MIRKKLIYTILTVLVTNVQTYETKEVELRFLGKSSDRKIKNAVKEFSDEVMKVVLFTRKIAQKFAPQTAIFLCNILQKNLQKCVDFFAKSGIIINVNKKWFLKRTRHMKER